MRVWDNARTYLPRGPKEADELLAKNNFVYTGRYKWKKGEAH